MDDKYVYTSRLGEPTGTITARIINVDYEQEVQALKDRLSALEKRSGLLSPSLTRQLWALFGRLVLLWIILGSVWLAVVLVALGLSGG